MAGGLGSGPTWPVAWSWALLACGLAVAWPAVAEEPFGPAAEIEPVSPAAAATLDAEAAGESEVMGSLRADTVAVNMAPALCGVLVLQWEHRFFERLSGVLIGGAGVGSSLSSFADMALLEVGAQVRGYVVATQRQAAGIAVEVMAGWLPSDTHSERRGQAISPRLVYRLVSDGGLTAEVQLGAAWTQRSGVQVGTGVRVNSGSGPAPIHALALGYTF
ncbi:MAG: hypothetical protein HY902_14835 [Deltaproteobacteria bacterium]|nr:hypothetical protein [Deltaproteobacteria bacterium]